MKRLLLLRHAKSSWAESGLDDHERPLNGRGRRAAPVMGALIAASGWRPDGIVCSSALRTRETLDLLRPHLDADIPVLIERELYHATAPQLLARLRRLPASWDSALLIGHNPGLGRLVVHLRGAASPEPPPAHFPTAALAVLEFSGSGWDTIEPGAGRLVALATPRDTGGGPAP